MITAFDAMTRALLQWQKLNRERVSQSLQLPSWKPALQLILAADSMDKYAQEHLAASLAESNQALLPLGDPLLLNLGKHRWLSTGREESYSDWLAWILQGMASEDVLHCFGYHDEAQIRAMGAVEEVGREHVIEGGRTDIEVRFGEHGLLLIEVKVQAPGNGLYSQLQKYSTWAKLQPATNKIMVLLGPEEPILDITPFKFIPWRELGSRLRNYANQIKGSDLLAGAAILIFCGAVEQNVIGISARPQRFRAMASLDYLETWRAQI